jgi:hypothetical protein
MNVERRRPVKMFEVIIAHGPYRVGDRIQPTGMYRDVLMRRGLIREVKDEPEVKVTESPMDRMIAPSEILNRRKRK